MATIFTRGFVRRSLPALLALVLGLLVAPQPAVAASPVATGSTAITSVAAAHLQATTRTVEHPAAAPSLPATAPPAPSTSVGAFAVQPAPRAQATAGVAGSRAPPAARA